MGHRENDLGAPPVLELEQLVDVVAPAVFQSSAGLSSGSSPSRAADGVHLLAHDLFHLPVHPPARGQTGPQTRTQLTNHPGPHHQSVRGRLGVRGGLARGGQRESPDSRVMAGESVSRPAAGSRSWPAAAAAQDLPGRRSVVIRRTPAAATGQVRRPGRGRARRGAAGAVERPGPSVWTDQAVRHGRRSAASRSSAW